MRRQDGAQPRGLTLELLSTLKAPACNCTRNCANDGWGHGGCRCAPPTVPHGRAQRPAQNVNSKETAVPAVQNGVRASSLDARWVKSRHSNAEGNCVEVASLVDGCVALRNSHIPASAAL